MRVFFISDVWRVEPKAIAFGFLVSGMFIEGK
ncbi:hypothetical protein ES708_20860 [subsurface metagenome]